MMVTSLSGRDSKPALHQWADPMPKWKRIFLWASAFVIACVVYLWFFGIQTFFILQTRKIGHEIPIVKSVPVKLQDLSVSKVKGEKLSFMGAEFEVPWDDVDQEKSRIVGNWALINFRSGNSIILCVSPPGSFITSISKNQAIDPRLFVAIYGPEVLRSDYVLHKAIFETTPSQVNLFTPTNRVAGLSSIILIKAIMPPTTDWAIYDIRSKDFRGFQLGDPERRPKKMCLELFADDVEFEINISQNTSGPTHGITQAEINRIIQTVHKAAHPQSIFTVNPS
jgi:hypothetical protein